MIKYNITLFGPPAPVASVTLIHPTKDTSISAVPMLLDYGADLSLIPQASVNQLGAVVIPDESFELMGFDGSVRITQAVQLDMIFLDMAFSGDFLLHDRDYGLLGRDILNFVSLYLDGPNLVWGERGSQ